MWPTVRGVLRSARRRPDELRHHVVREAWTLAKRFAADEIVNIELREIPCIHTAVVEGYVDDYQRLVIAALVRGLGCETLFEFGTNRGRATWTIARTNPGLTLYTLDLPVAESHATEFALGDDDAIFAASVGGARGEAFRGTPEAERITQLAGDSASFDYSPYEGKMDFVYIDGAHTYEYVKSDTENALRMLTPTGTIAWDDYTTGTGVYRYLSELAPTLDRTVFHVFGTRMALYSRQEFVRRLPFNDYESTPAL
jgi:predicted O-methyltransferase YrrM